jgi:hypothetical protein
LAYCLALRSPGGLVITVALWETEAPSGLALERYHAFSVPFGQLKPTKSMLHQSGVNSPGTIHCQRRYCFLCVQSLLFGFAGSNNPLFL